jgi:sporulation protein YlmC with PRC-barrel domain
VGHNGPTGPWDLTSSTPAAPDPSAAAPSDRLWLRSELMGTQVITRDTGRRLGVVGEVVVDIDRREVVALGLRDNPLTRFLPGLPRWMPLERIRQVGDVILVDSADSLDEGFDPERYSKVINCQVITESGAQLGRVLGFSFDVETGELTTLVIGALGVPLLGEGVLSTWELPVGEIVSSGTDRIIVYEGAEEKLKQLGTGLLEKLGIGGSSWEQEERDRFRSSAAVPAENQLPAGQPSVAEQRRIQPATSRVFRPEEELDYVEVEERREREPLRQRRYLDEPELPPEPRNLADRGPEARARRDDDGYDRYPERPQDRFRDLEREPRLERNRDLDRYPEWAERGEPERSQERYQAREPYEGRERYDERERYEERPTGPDPDRFEPAPAERWAEARPAAPRADFNKGEWEQEGGQEPRQAEEEPRQALEPRRPRPERVPPADRNGPIGREPAPRPVDVEAELLDDPW